MDTNLNPEILVPRLGEYLIQKRIISETELQKALEYQDLKKKKGEHCLLGQAMVELHLLSRSQIDHAVTEQIIQLRNALEESNHSLESRVLERTAELQEALKKLSELSQMKANFISNVSHELRTPLTHIKGYLELLINESLGGLSAEQKKALQVSQRATGRLENLIDSLILFSLAAKGEMNLDPIPTNLNRVVEEVIQYSIEKANDRNVSLKVNIQTDLPEVRADKEKITWVILQLIDNAIKFTPEGGEISLTIQLESDQLIMVSVTDTGIGIPAEKRKEIFEVFHQLDSSSTRRYGGTGLGLALVREILNAHGSVIEVESVEGKGTCFRFSLLVIR